MPHAIPQTHSAFYPHRPGMIIDEVMKNLGNCTSVFVVVVVVGNYSDVDRKFNKSEKKV